MSTLMLTFARKETTFARLYRQSPHAIAQGLCQKTYLRAYWCYRAVRLRDLFGRNENLDNSQARESANSVHSATSSRS